MVVRLLVWTRSEDFVLLQLHWIVTVDDSEVVSVNSLWRLRPTPAALARHSRPSPAALDRHCGLLWGCQCELTLKTSSYSSCTGTSQWMIVRSSVWTHSEDFVLFQRHWHVTVVDSEVVSVNSLWRLHRSSTSKTSFSYLTHKHLDELTHWVALALQCCLGIST